VGEEMTELSEEVKAGTSQEKIEEEFGDVLFYLVNYARFINVNPENALARTNKKFIERFQLMEELMKSDATPLESSSLEVMDTYWEKAKKIKRSENS